MKNKIIASAMLLVFFATAPLASAATFNQDLHVGLTNNSDVMALQTVLTSQGFFSDTATGNFFNLTQAAVMAFQLKNGISPTGYVGPLTRAALNKLSTTSGISGSFANVDANASQLLANTPSLQTQYQNSLAASAQPVNFGTYPQGTVADYTKNPGQFLNSGISIKNAFVSDFLAAGDRGGSNGYVEITNYSIGQEKMMIEAYNAADYTKISSVLNKGEFVVVYGIGAQSQSFSASNAFTSYDHLEPVIVVQRIDKCDPYDCSSGHTTTVFDRTGSAIVSNVVPVQSTTANVVGTINSASTQNTDGYISNTTQALLRSYLTNNYNKIGNDQDLVNDLSGGYGVQTMSYLNAQLQANPSNIQVQQSYLSTVIGYYQSLDNAAGIMENDASGINNSFSGYLSSSDLTPTQQQTVTDLNSYAQSKISDYFGKVNSITASLAKYRGMQNGQMDAQSLTSASADLSALQSYLVGERNAMMQKLKGAMGVF